jgi:hypothetical protein
LRPIWRVPISFGATMFIFTVQQILKYGNMIKIWPIIPELDWHIHKHNISTNVFVFWRETTYSCMPITVNWFISQSQDIYICAKKLTENLKFVLLSSLWLKKHPGPQIPVTIIVYMIWKNCSFYNCLYLASLYYLNNLCYYSSPEMFNGGNGENMEIYRRLLHTKMGSNIQVTNTRCACQFKLFQVLFILHLFFTVSISFPILIHDKEISIFYTNTF